MAARALARFTVQHGRLRVQVRLLPTVADVDAEFRAGKRRRNGLVTFATSRRAMPARTAWAPSCCRPMPT